MDTGGLGTIPWHHHRYSHGTRGAARARAGQTRTDRRARPQMLSKCTAFCSGRPCNEPLLALTSCRVMNGTQRSIEDGAKRNHGGARSTFRRGHSGSVSNYRGGSCSPRLNGAYGEHSEEDKSASDK